MILSLAGACAASCGAGAYLLARADLGRQRAALLAAGCAGVVGVGFLFVLYLAVLAFLAAVAVHLLVRSRSRVGVALAASATAFAGSLAASVLVLSSALDSM